MFDKITSAIGLVASGIGFIVDITVRVRSILKRKPKDPSDPHLPL